MNTPSVVLLEWRIFKRAERYCLGLNYIDAALKNAGYRVHTFLFEDVSVEKACQEILDCEPDVVGIRFYSETAEPTFEIARKLKEKNPQIKIVVGGHTATLYGALILNQEVSIDAVINGEGELTFIDICERIKDNMDFKGCPGTVYRDGNTIYRNNPRSFISDLDTTIFPDNNIFLDNKDVSNQFVEYAISTARGCVGNCYFCVINRVYEENGKKHWRGMSPEKIVDEIKKATSILSDKRLNVKFVDSAFEDPDPKTKKRLRKIVELIEENNINIAFSFFTRAESWAPEDEDLVIRMKKIGLYKVSIGFDESIKLSSVRNFTKNAMSNEKIEASSMFQRNGIQPYGYLILFHPYITIEDLLEGADFLDKIGMSQYPDVWTHEVILYPDTRLFSHVVSSGLLLGTDSGGYSYKYAYEDGRVGKVVDVIREVRELKSFRNIRSTMLKIDTDVDIYNAWNSRLNEMEKIEVEMKSFKSKVISQYKDFGFRQKELFLSEIVNVIAGESDNKVENIKKWDQLYKEQQIELEKIWLQNRIQIGRKKVRLS